MTRLSKTRTDFPLIAITMLSMAMLILGLSVIVVVQKDREKAPVIINRTERVDHLRLPINVTIGTYRLKTSTKVVNLTTLGAIQSTTEDAVGTAWGINLKEYGLNEKRYLITAAHCISRTKDKSADIVEIQIRTSKVKKWIKCKILIIDKDRDSALLEAEEDIPVVFKLGDDSEVEVGKPVIVVGCPIGTTPAAALGYLTSKDPEVPIPIRCSLWQASVPFYFGNSGGPIIDAVTQDVIGILVAGVGTKDGLVPNLAIIIPCFEVRKMLDDNLKLPDEPAIPELKAETVPLPAK